MALQASAKGHLSKASLQMEWRKTMNYQCTSNPVPGVASYSAGVRAWYQGGIRLGCRTTIHQVLTQALTVRNLHLLASPKGRALPMKKSTFQLVVFGLFCALAA